MNPRNKYGAIRTTYGERTYDSKAEAAFAAELDMMQRANAILGWLPQVPFYLPGGVRFVVDFLVLRENGETCEAIDVKGVPTAVFKVKLRQARELYPWVKFRAITRKGKRWIEVLPEKETT